MKPLTTLILGGVVLLLAIAITAVDRISPSPESRSVLLRFEKDRVETITIRQGERTVELKKIEDTWLFTRPRQDRINLNAIHALLDELNHLAILDRLDEGTSRPDGRLDPAFGFDAATAIQVRVITSDKGKSEEKTIVLGAPGEREGTLYASRDGKEVSIVDGNPRDLLEDPLVSLREPRLITAPGQGLVQIAVKTPDTEAVVRRTVLPAPQPWRLVHPHQAGADQEKVDDLLAALMKLEVFDVADPVSPSFQIPDPLPENSLLVQLGVLGSEKPVVMFLRKDPELSDDFGPPVLNARISDRPPTFLVRSMILDTIPELTAKLRDRRLGQFPENALQSIVVLSRVDPTVILKANRTARGANWTVQIGGKDVDANYGKISALVEKMNAPVIIDFVGEKKLADYGLDPAEMRVSFGFHVPETTLPDGTVRPAETVERILQFGFRNENAPRLFANFLGEKEIFELDPAFANAIPTHPVKWRSVEVLNFNRFNLQSITRSIPGRGEIKLEYDKDRDRWKATREGVELPGNVDHLSASALRDRLASLRARGWLFQVGPAYEALKTPSATFHIETLEFDRAVNEPRPRKRTLRLARPTPDGIIFGRIDEHPDVFYLDNNVYKALLRPVTDSVIRGE